MHTLLHILGITLAVIAGIGALIVVGGFLFFADAEENGENPFQ